MLKYFCMLMDLLCVIKYFFKNLWNEINENFL